MVCKQIDSKAADQLRRSLLAVAYCMMNKRRVHVEIYITKESSILIPSKVARRIHTKNTRALGVLITYINFV